MMMRAIFIGILVLMSAGIGAATFNWYRTEHVARSFGEPFILVDHTGEEITEQAFRGTPTALFFGFTHCPEVCPTTLWELDTWLDEMDGAVNGYFVSIDPERDTVDVMGNYVTNVSDRITGITGEPDKIAAMARSFGIYVGTETSQARSLMARTPRRRARSSNVLQTAPDHEPGEVVFYPRSRQFAQHLFAHRRCFRG
jgi:protein SCO1